MNQSDQEEKSLGEKLLAGAEELDVLCDRFEEKHCGQVAYALILSTAWSYEEAAVELRNESKISLAVAAYERAAVTYLKVAEKAQLKATQTTAVYAAWTNAKYGKSGTNGESALASGRCKRWARYLKEENSQTEPPITMRTVGELRQISFPHNPKPFVIPSQFAGSINEPKATPKSSLEQADIEPPLPFDQLLPEFPSAPQHPQPLVDRRVRQHVLGVNAIIPPHETVTLSVYPQLTFRGQRFVLPMMAQGCLIHDIRVGNVSAFQGPVSGHLISEVALNLDTCQVGQLISIVVENTSAAVLQFQGALTGLAIEAFSVAGRLGE